MAELGEISHARGHCGYVSIDGQTLYAEYDPPVAGCPTLILLNGLSDNTSSWDAFFSVFKKMGYGSLRFDFRGQGRSLMHEITETGGFHKAVSVEEQSGYLAGILDHFRIDEPLHIVGMSYGGGIALHFAAHQPEKVRKLFLVAPYLIRLDQALPLQRIWAGQFEMMRGLGVIPGTTFETAQRLYHQFLNHYMNHRFHRAIPNETIRKASIQLTFGIMKFNAFPLLAALPASSVHLVTAGADTLVPRNLYSEMWSRLPRSVKESWLFVEDGEHLLFEQYPEFLGRWVERILEADPRIEKGQKFNGCGYSHEVRYGLNEKIRL